MSLPAESNAAERGLLWLAGNLLLAAAVAWLAFLVQQERVAPAALFPIVVGAIVGAGGQAISRATRVPRRLAVAGAVLWGLLVVVGQDYIGHRHRLRLYDAELARQHPLSAMAAFEHEELRPRFWPYWSSIVRGQPAWWGLELTLTCGAAAMVTSLGLRERPPTSSTEV